MDKDHVKINTPGTLTITAQKVSGQPPATHGGQQIAINYLSGAIGAKQKFRVDTGQTLVFSGSFQAPVAKGMHSIPNTPTPIHCYTNHNLLNTLPQELGLLFGSLEPLHGHPR
jgi:hypothetical protein